MPDPETPGPATGITGRGLEPQVWIRSTYFPVSTSTRLPCYRLGRKILFRRSEVDRWMGDDFRSFASSPSCRLLALNLIVNDDALSA